MSYCNLNGQLIDVENATISVQDRGFRFGDGIFETIGVNNGVPYQFEWHLQRLIGGLAALKISFDTTVLPPYCREILHKNAVRGGFLRLQITRGNGSKGYLPTGNTPTMLIETMNPASFEAPVTLWESSYTKPSSQSMPLQYKLCQGVNSTLARMEAIEHGCFDALLLNDKGEVCETSSGNVFWAKGGNIFTPSLACGILEGSTRAALLRLLPDIREIEASADILHQSDEVCITNVAWKALPVASLGATKWLSGALAAQCAQILERDRMRYSNSNHAQWK